MCLRPEDVAVSLGTSDTLFFSTKHARTSRTGHVLVSPLHPDQRMVLICFKNGSQTRERISRECAENNWTLFAELLDSTPRGNFGHLSLYLDQIEIRPRVSGDHRFNRFDQPVARFSKEVEVRACVEGQFVRLRAHAQQMGFQLPCPASVSIPGTTEPSAGQSVDKVFNQSEPQHRNEPDDDPQTSQTKKVGEETHSNQAQASSTSAVPRILATGGASRNKSLLQVLADVFNCPVYVQKQPNSACYGSALMAKNGKSRHLKNPVFSLID